MNVICFGNLGYLGTVLNKTLESNSSNYVGFDTGYFKATTDNDLLSSTTPSKTTTLVIEGVTSGAIKTLPFTVTYTGS